MFVIVTRPPKLPVVSTVTPFFQTKLNGPVPLAVVVKLVVEPWQTVLSGGSLVAVFAFTVRFALCEALPQAPVVVTVTV